MLLAPTISQPQSGSVFRPASEHLSPPQKGFLNGATGTKHLEARWRIFEPMTSSAPEVFLTHMAYLL